MQIAPHTEDILIATILIVGVMLIASLSNTFLVLWSAMFKARRLLLNYLFSYFGNLMLLALNEQKILISVFIPDILFCVLIPIVIGRHTFISFLVVF